MGFDCNDSTNHSDTLVIVSNDSDFTAPIKRLYLKTNKKVWIVCEKGKGQHLVSVSDKHIYIENISSTANIYNAFPNEYIFIIKTIINEKGGIIRYDQLGALFKQKHPQFSAATYGCKNLWDILFKLGDSYGFLLFEAGRKEVSTWIPSPPKCKVLRKSINDIHDTYFIELSNHNKLTLHNLITHIKTNPNYQELNHMSYDDWLSLINNILKLNHYIYLSNKIKSTLITDKEEYLDKHSDNSEFNTNPNTLAIELFKSFLFKSIQQQYTSPLLKPNQICEIKNDVFDFLIDYEKKVGNKIRQDIFNELINKSKGFQEAGYTNDLINKLNVIINELINNISIDFQTAEEFSTFMTEGFINVDGIRHRESWILRNISFSKIQ